MANRPESSDSYFNWDDIQVKNNNELITNPGNLTNRVLKFIFKNKNQTIPSCEPNDLEERDKEFLQQLMDKFKEYDQFQPNANSIHNRGFLQWKYDWKNHNTLFFTIIHLFSVFPRIFKGLACESPKIGFELDWNRSYVKVLEAVKIKEGLK